jgi:hypothetical protein
LEKNLSHASFHILFHFIHLSSFHSVLYSRGGHNAAHAHHWCGLCKVPLIIWNKISYLINIILEKT